MKRTMHLLILGLLVSYPCFSQTDSVSVISAGKDSIDAKYDRIYKYFIEDKKEIKHLWKVNIVNFSFFAPNIVYEQKIGKSFSSETYLKLGTFANYNNFQYYSYGFFVNQGIKYYYNIKKRELKGKRTNGFNGNYFALVGFYGHVRNVHPDSSSIPEHLSNYGLALRYGLQRRLGNIGYIEPFVQMGGINYSNNTGFHFTMSIGLNAGFSLDSFKNHGNNKKSR
jgi:hypothetical protein